MSSSFVLITCFDGTLARAITSRKEKLIYKPEKFFFLSCQCNGNDITFSTYPKGNNSVSIFLNWYVSITISELEASLF